MKDIYVLPDYFQNIEELDRWMKKFHYLTLRQKILSNDASIETYGKNNYTRYDEMRSRLLNSNTKPIEDRNDDYNNTSSSVSINTESYLPSENVLGINHTDSDEDWEESIIKARSSEHIGLVIMIDTTEPIKSFKDYDIETLQLLNDKWEKINSLPQDKRILSDQTAYTIFGVNNINLYTKLKNYITNKLDNRMNTRYYDNIDDTINNTRNTINVNIKDPVASAVIENLINEEYESIIKSGSLKEQFYSITNKKILDDCKDKYEKERKNRPVPFFTPDEMLGFGVFSGEVNLYSPKPDNSTILGQSVVEWFEYYKKYHMVYNESDWVDKLNELYEDFDSIKESDDDEKISARKQSILELGWNPEISFNKDIAKRAIYRNESYCMNEVRVSDMSDMYVSFKDHKYPKSDSINPVYILYFDDDFYTLGISFDLDMVHCIRIRDNTFNIDHVELSIISKDISIVQILFLYDIDFNNFKNQVYFNQIEKYALKSALNKVIKESCHDKLLYYILEYSLSSFNDIMVYQIYNKKLYCDVFNAETVINAANGLDRMKLFENDTFSNLNYFNTSNIENLIEMFKGIELPFKSNVKNITPINERVKDVSVDEKGNLHIRTVADVNTEFFKCHRNLISYEKAGNYQGMKDELCKLKYLDNFAVRHMKNKNNKNYKEYADAHARITNDFNKYLKIITDKEPDFNFSEYYKKSDWYDGEVVISKSIIDILIEILGGILKK